MTFKRSMGLPILLLTAIGSIVGSGWLFGALYAAKIAGPAAIISWILGAALMLVVSFTFGELAANTPVAGGMIHFAERSHGRLLSFTIGWLTWLSSMTVAPIETLALLQYASNYFPDLMQKIDGTAVLTHSGLACAAALMLALTLMNQYAIRTVSRISAIIVVIKLIVPILTLAILFTACFHAANFTAQGGFMPYGWHGILTALPLGGVVYSFLGNSTIIQLAAETKNPRRNLPLALGSSIVFCALLYVSLQIAFIGGLSASNLATGWKHLSFTGENGPFAGILSALGVTWLVIMIYIDAVISPLGTALIYTGATARINHALAKTGFFPKSFTRLNTHGTPLRALLFNYLAGLALFMPFPGWQKMLGFIVSCFIIAYSIGPLALMPMRAQLAAQTGNRQFAFRLPAGHLFALLAFYICNLLLFWSGWQNVQYLLIAMSLGAALFAAQYLANENENSNRKAVWRTQSLSLTAPWLLLYFVGMGILAWFGSFGGKNIMPFGWDFPGIFIFSAVIYFLAMRASNKYLKNQGSPQITKPVDNFGDNPVK